MGSGSINLYWWSPLRRVRELPHQIAIDGQGWAHGVLRGGLPFVNFGDELSPLMARNASGLRVNWVPAERAELIGIGSVIEHWLASHSSAYIWGSGLLRPQSARRGTVPSSRVLAVRGEVTRTALGLGSHVPLGDPALLLRDYAVGTRTNSGDRIVVIPRHTSLRDRRVRELLRRAAAMGWKVVSPTASPRHVIGQIRSAAIVLSSSLHGKIVADALGVPSALFDTETDHGHREKYDDYMSVWGRPARFFDLERILRGLPDELRVHATADAAVVEREIDTIALELKRTLLDALGDRMDPLHA